jgi:potassium efflux system protein
LALARFGILIAVLALCAAPLAAGAQTPAAPAAPAQQAPAVLAMTSIASLSDAVDQAEAQLHAVRAATRAADVDDATLKTQIALLPPLQAGLAQNLSDLTQRLQNVNLRLAQVGPAPTPPQTEAPEISESRHALARQQQAIDTEVKQARLVAVEAQQLDATLTARRQQMFSRRLWAPSRSVLSPNLWIDFAAAAPKDVASLQGVMADEAAQFSTAARTPGALPMWIVGILAALLLLGPVRVLLDRFGFAQIARFGPDSRLRRSGLALWLAVTAGVTPLLAGLILRGVLVDANALTPPLEQFAELGIRVLVSALLFEGLGRAILSPGRPSWRMAPIPDEVVARLAPYPAVIAVTAALASLAQGAGAVFGASMPTSVASDCITLLLELAAVAGGLGRIGQAHHGRNLGTDNEQEVETRLPWMLAALGAWLTIACAILAVLFGYLAMGSFLARQMIWTALVLAGLFVSVTFIDDLFPALLSPRRSVGRFAQIAIGLSPTALDPISVLLSGLCRLALFLLAWIVVTEPFGGAAGDLYGSLTSGPLVLKLGQVSISPGLVLGGVVVFMAGLALTRAIRGWFDTRYLPKTRMDLGARTSLSLAITYLGGLIAALAACAYLGVSLDKITLVASALSVGIGFGLQAIIGNFISGLILLAERPVKVGDWIAIGDLEGDVLRVNVRATEIQMADRSKLIIPNSDLISKPVRNITHGGSLGRVSLLFKIDAGVEPERVRALFLERMGAHPDVLDDPRPGVFMTNVKDGALEFQAVAYVHTPRDVYRVKSELLYQLIPAMKAADIAFAGTGPSTIVINAPADAPRPA